jgi:hypothetical protein
MILFFNDRHQSDEATRSDAKVRKEKKEGGMKKERKGRNDRTKGRQGGGMGGMNK